MNEFEKLIQGNYKIPFYYPSEYQVRILADPTLPYCPTYSFIPIKWKPYSDVLTRQAESSKND